MPRLTVAPGLIAALALGTFALARAQDRAPAVVRDTPAQTLGSAERAPSGRIAGQVVAADSGRPIAGARVQVNAPEMPRGMVVLTDDNGAFEVAGLAPGRYTVNVSRAGFINLSYGQRRPLQPGTPLQLGDAQGLTGIDFRLPRGSVITGRVFDQGGEPVPGATVRVMRYQYVQGTRQLVPSGSGQADDRGQFRVWGLNPGDYYVSAVAPNPNLGDGGRGDAPVPVGRGVVVMRGAGGVAFSAGGGDPDSAVYAPTYYPGVPSSFEAQAITVGLGTEAAGIDFSLLRMETSVVSGRIIGIDGNPARNAVVTLSPEGQAIRGGGPFAGTYTGRAQEDGAFTIRGVPPGRYLLRAMSGGGGRGRGGNPNESASTSQPLSVTGDTSVHLALAPGGSLSGSISLPPSTSPPDLTQFRVAAMSVGAQAPGGAPSARADREGVFTVDGIVAGPALIRGQAPAGWVLESVIAGGRDIVDTPIEIRSGERLSGLRVTFSDRLTEISGQVLDPRGAPVPEFTVLAFPTDASLWHAQSRHIRTTRPDQTGQYQLRGLPPAEYFLAVIDPVEPGEWFEPTFLEAHRTGAARVTIAAGDVRTQDFRVAGQ